MVHLGLGLLVVHLGLGLLVVHLGLGLLVALVGMMLWEPPMGVPMVVVDRGKHVVGYSLLAIKSIG